MHIVTFSDASYNVTMRVRILTSCTSQKAVDAPDALTAADLRREESHLSARIAALQRHAMSAGDLYTGRQHQHLMRAVTIVRSDALKSDALDISISVLSAAFGLVPEDALLVPYDVTFSTMSRKEIAQVADRLAIPDQFRRWAVSDGDLSLMLLGEKYLQAIRPDAEIQFGSPTLIFCGPRVGQELPDWGNRVRKIALAKEEARRFRQGLVWLKGYLAATLLLGLSRRPDMVDRLFDRDEDPLVVLEEHASQKVLEL